jgi:hypothetical protein
MCLKSTRAGKTDLKRGTFCPRRLDLRGQTKPTLKIDLNFVFVASFPWLHQLEPPLTSSSSLLSCGCRVFCTLWYKLCLSHRHRPWHVININTVIITSSLLSYDSRKPPFRAFHPHIVGTHVHHRRRLSRWHNNGDVTATSREYNLYDQQIMRDKQRILAREELMRGKN